MGYMRHHAIIVTSWKEELIELAKATADECFPWVSSISPDGVNGYRSFFIPPDGSKEGWDKSDLGDAVRKTFLDWVDKQAHEDGSNPLECIEIAFGRDGPAPAVTRTSWLPEVESS